MPAIARQTKNSRIVKRNGGKYKLVFAIFNTELNTYIMFCMAYPLIILITIFNSGKLIKAPITKLINCPLDMDEASEPETVSKNETPESAIVSMKSPVINLKIHEKTAPNDDVKKSRITFIAGLKRSEKKSTKLSNSSSMLTISPP